MRSTNHTLDAITEAFLSLSQTTWNTSVKIPNSMFCFVFPANIFPAVRPVFSAVITVPVYRDRKYVMDYSIVLMGQMKTYMYVQNPSARYPTLLI